MRAVSLQRFPAAPCEKCDRSIGHRYAPKAPFDGCSLDLRQRRDLMLLQTAVTSGWLPEPDVQQNLLDQLDAAAEWCAQGVQHDGARPMYVRRLMRIWRILAAMMKFNDMPARQRLELIHAKTRALLDKYPAETERAFRPRRPRRNRRPCGGGGNARFSSPTRGDSREDAAP